MNQEQKDQYFMQKALQEAKFAFEKMKFQLEQLLFLTIKLLLDVIT